MHERAERSGDFFTPSVQYSPVVNLAIKIGGGGYPGVHSQKVGNLTLGDTIVTKLPKVPIGPVSGNIFIRGKKKKNGFFFNFSAKRVSFVIKMYLGQNSRPISYENRPYSRTVNRFREESITKFTFILRNMYAFPRYLRGVPSAFFLMWLSPVGSIPVTDVWL